MDTEMKMLITCTCGTKLRVLISQYLQMRCPTCKTMLAKEIERQASRNSRIVQDMSALLLHDRMTAKRWTYNDEAMCRVIARHEIESHGGQWPPPAPPQSEPQMTMPSSHEQSAINPLNPPVVVDRPRERKPIKKIVIKVKTKKRRRRSHDGDGE